MSVACPQKRWEITEKLKNGRPNYDLTKDVEKGGWMEGLCELFLVNKSCEHVIIIENKIVT